MKSTVKINFVAFEAGAFEYYIRGSPDTSKSDISVWLLICED